MKIRFTRETLAGLVVLAGALMVASLSATATADPTSVTCDGQPARIVGTAHDGVCLLSQSPGDRATERQSKGASPHQLRDCGLPKSD
jgi:hypothetical protein